MSSSDGLDDTEIIKLLFKNYMNSITTSHSKKFYEESDFANNSNIFSSGLLIDLPPIYNTTPTLVSVTNSDTLTEYLSYSAIPNINIDMGSYIHPSQNGSTISGTLGKGDITNISVLSKNGNEIPIQTNPTDPIIFLRNADDQWKYLGEKPMVVPVYYPIDFNITG